MCCEPAARAAATPARIKGRKGHAIVDTDGRTIGSVAKPYSVPFFLSLHVIEQPIP